MRGPTTTGTHEVIDLTASTSSRPGETGQRQQIAGQRGPTSGPGTKRKHSHVDEEHRVIGQLKRVHLMEGAGRDGEEVVLVDDISEDVRVLDVREGPCGGHGEENGVAGTAEAAGCDGERGQEPDPQWYLGDVGPSPYQEVNRMLGQAHHAMMGRRRKT
mmetsp:Transcript_7217/g.19755  ORF Transcript_7217/g.19755 Transcript_7217/m.19755 type:complete len:159 (+) Transcript_7217:204-680(+)